MILRRAACSFGLAATLVFPNVALHAAPVEATEGFDPLARLMFERGVIGLVTPAAGIRPAAQLPDRATAAVLTAMNFLDIPYVYGGTDNNGFDCSGFTRHVYETSLGVVLPRSTEEQASARGFVAVDASDLRPGDLVFFNTMQRDYSHVGIYVGNDRFIHSPSTGRHVRLEQMGKAYWQTRYTGARRLDSGAQLAATR